MKKSITIFLLGLMFYNMLGYYFAYRTMINDAKMEMKNEIENSSISEKLILIKLPYKDGKVEEKDFKTVDDGEFIYRDEMYDIVYSKVYNDFIYLYCINDSKEETINIQLNKHIEDNLTDAAIPQKKKNKTDKDLIKEYLPFKDITLIYPPISAEKLFFPQEEVLILRLDVDTPPPKS